VPDLALHFGECGGQLGGDEAIVVCGQDALQTQPTGVERFGEQLDDPLDCAA
jgi:hypothetical protein